MTENEFLLQDRITKIKSIIQYYGEENFYISYSGGKDSTVLSALIDLSIPNNRIPRVFVNTGIELNKIVDFVKSRKEKDERIIIIAPTKNIKSILNIKGYPFKSKRHSKYLDLFQRLGKTRTIRKYIGEFKENEKPWVLQRRCPKKLLYQFNGDFAIRVSDKCCDELKKQPLKKWQKDNNKTISILGIRRQEEGNRVNAKCIFYSNNKIKSFNPLAPITNNFIDWFIEQYKIEICDLYKAPYNFDRTGCKGCPFNVNLQSELETLGKYFPSELKQCEIIWRPIYDEYRRIGYRLKGR